MKNKANYLKIIFIACFFINTVSCMAQGRDIDAMHYEPVATYHPGDTYNKNPLYLTHKIKNFDYTGSFRCTILIDTLEKAITQVRIDRIEISNGVNSISLRIPKDMPISEYSGEHSDIIHKIYPFMESHVLGLKLIRDRQGTPKTLDRFYFYSIKIKIL